MTMKRLAILASAAVLLFLAVHLSRKPAAAPAPFPAPVSPARPPAASPAPKRKTERVAKVPPPPKPPVAPAPPAPVVSAPVAPPVPPAVAIATVAPPPPPAPPPPAPAALAAGELPSAPDVELHKELIPENVAITRISYAAEAAAPGTVLGFEIVGSGFDADFLRTIQVDSGDDGVQARNLLLVSPNRIHGEFAIGPAVSTKFFFPTVLKNGLALYVAEDFFGVIRPREVLYIRFSKILANGQSKKFRVWTNIGPEDFKTFAVEPTGPGLKISKLTPTYPFAVDGQFKIAYNADSGKYGLIVSVGSREIYRLDAVVSVVDP